MGKSFVGRLNPTIVVVGALSAVFLALPAQAQSPATSPRYTLLAEGLLGCAAAFNVLSKCPYQTDDVQLPQTYAAQAAGFFGAGAQVMATASSSYGQFNAMVRRQQRLVQERVGKGERCQTTADLYFAPCLVFLVRIRRRPPCGS